MSDLDRIVRELVIANRILANEDVVDPYYGRSTARLPRRKWKIKGAMPRSETADARASRGQFSEARRTKSAPASSGVTHRSNTTPHGHAIRSR